MRRICLALGLVVLGLAWLGPLELWLPGPFSAHMSKHMAVVAVAAPLIALGLAGSSRDPVVRHPGWFPPILASMLELVVVWAWHTPRLHQLARTLPAALLVEQASFLASGLWLWLAALGGSAQGRQERRGAGIMALLLTSMHMTLLGALLALPPRPLFEHAHHHGGAHAAHGGPLSSLSDQHLGGAIMLTLGGAVYMLAGLLLAFGVLRARREAAGSRREVPHP